jgi:hypothetical protein
VAPYVSHHVGRMGKRIIYIATGIIRFRFTVLVFIFLSFLLISFGSLPAALHRLIYNSCLQGQAPQIICSNGVFTTSLPTNEGSMNIGLLENLNTGPFNQYDSDPEWALRP